MRGGRPLRYTKPHLSYAAQAQLLLDRGMQASSRRELEEHLQAVSYYRLSGYWIPFKQADNTFRPGTTFEKVWRRYVFDRQLRLLVMDPVERVEVAVRSQIVEKLTDKHGAFAHLSAASFAPTILAQPRNARYATVHDELVDQIRECVRRSNEQFVKHFHRKYTAEPDLPFWMAAEVMMFGNVLTCYRHLQPSMQKSLAANFGVPAAVLESWLLCLNYVRNLCAHHSRFWNRNLSVKPMIPRTLPEWHIPQTIPNQQAFAVLTLLRYLLQRIAPRSRWEIRLVDLLNDYQDLPLIEMGFLPDWEKCPIWAGIPNLPGSGRI